MSRALTKIETEELEAIFAANDHGPVCYQIYNRPKYRMHTGKNFSGYSASRRKSDFYETPYSLTSQFLNLNLLDPAAPTLEPAAGDGAMVRILGETFTDLTFYDQETDFLTETGKVSQIITNPPFSLAFEFIQKAKEVAEDRFAMLLPLSYLHGKQRLDHIYSDKEYGLKSVHVFSRYPMFGDPLRADGKYRTGMMVMAWFLWENRYPGAPSIGWIDNSPYVLSKSDKADLPLSKAA